MLGQFGRLFRCTVSREIRGRGDNSDPHSRANGQCHHIVLKSFAQSDASIKPPRDEIHEIVFYRDLDFNTRMLSNQRTQRRPENRVGRVFSGTDPDSSNRFIAQVGEQLDFVGQFIERGRKFCQQTSTGMRRRNTARCARQKPEPNVFLQPLERLAERRLSNAEPLSGARKTAFSSNDAENFQIARAALAAGETVVATARSANDITEARGTNSRLHALSLDITDEGAAVAAAQEAVDLVGTIDVLVNNAGQAKLGWFETISSEQVRRQFEVNVFGTMNVTRAVTPHMRARQSGLIVTISSVNGLLANPGGSVYASSKFAIEGWIEGFAQEWAAEKVNRLKVELKQSVDIAGGN